MQVLLLLRHPNVAALWDFCTKWVCHMITWAIINNKRAFFDQISLLTDLDYSRCCKWFQEALLSTTLDSVHNAKSLDRQHFPEFQATWPNWIGLDQTRQKIPPGQGDLPPPSHQNQWQPILIKVIHSCLLCTNGCIKLQHILTLLKLPSPHPIRTYPMLEFRIVHFQSRNLGV